jgi:hypothetical protein
MKYKLYLGVLALLIVGVFASCRTQKMGMWADRGEIKSH